MLSKEELIKIGVNPDNIKDVFGSMNIIVQNVHGYDEEAPAPNDTIELNPDIYHPRKNHVWTCACQGDGYELVTPEHKKHFVSRLRDSAERLKILAYYLSKQADEIEEFGYPKTQCYYPE